MPAPLKLSRSQILSYRRHVGALERRLPLSAKSIRQAAWAGLQDSMPRAALLSLHARLSGCKPLSWEHSSLIQLWGPRHNNYVIASKDLAVFSLGRLPDDNRRLARALDVASRLLTFLNGRRMPFKTAGKALGRDPNMLRYAAPTGTVLMRWDGARQADVWNVPAPNVDPRDARLELARRYLHIFGPTTATSFGKWAGIQPIEARNAFAALSGSLTPVRTPIGEAWILAEDEKSIRAKERPAAAARLLPSGDTYYLLWDDDRKMLLPESKQRAALWTSRVWPGALLVGGEIAGTWRRAGAEVSIQAWRKLSSAERKSVEAEAMSLPLPGLDGPMVISWNDSK